MRGNPVLLSTVVSTFGVGVFAMGTVLVILPIVNADVYRHEAGGSRNIVVKFWAGTVFSLVAISGLRKLTRLGRLLLIAQLAGSAGVLKMVTGGAYWALLSLVFI